MFKKLCDKIKRYIYNKMIIRVTLLDRDTGSYYDSIRPFCVTEMETEHGVFLFSFKEDRRKKDIGRSLMVNYIVHLEPPEGLTSTGIDLNEKIMIAIKVMLVSIDYEVLVSILMDKYLNGILKLYEEKG